MDDRKYYNEWRVKVNVAKLNFSQLKQISRETNLPFEKRCGTKQELQVALNKHLHYLMSLKFKALKEAQMKLHVEKIALEKVTDEIQSFEENFDLFNAKQWLNADIKDEKWKWYKSKSSLYQKSSIAQKKLYFPHLFKKCYSRRRTEMSRCSWEKWYKGNRYICKNAEFKYHLCIYHQESCRKRHTSDCFLHGQFHEGLCSGHLFLKTGIDVKQKPFKKRWKRIKGVLRHDDYVTEMRSSVKLAASSSGTDFGSVTSLSEASIEKVEEQGCGKLNKAIFDLISFSFKVTAKKRQLSKAFKTSIRNLRAYRTIKKLMLADILAKKIQRWYRKLRNQAALMQEIRINLSRRKEESAIIIQTTFRCRSKQSDYERHKMKICQVAPKIQRCIKNYLQGRRCRRLHSVLTLQAAFRAKTTQASLLKQLEIEYVKDRNAQTKWKQLLVASSFTEISNCFQDLIKEMETLCRKRTHFHVLFLGVFQHRARVRLRKASQKLALLYYTFKRWKANTLQSAVLNICSAIMKQLFCLEREHKALRIQQMFRRFVRRKRLMKLRKLTAINFRTKMIGKRLKPKRISFQRRHREHQNVLNPNFVMSKNQLKAFFDM